MRGGIPVEKHDNVIAFYGDYSGYRKTLGIEDTDFAYVFLLDQRRSSAGKGRGMRNLRLKENFLRLQRLSYDN